MGATPTHDPPSCKVKGGGFAGQVSLGAPRNPVAIASSGEGTARAERLSRPGCQGPWRWPVGSLAPRAAPQQVLCSVPARVPCPRRGMGPGAAADSAPGTVCAVRCSTTLRPHRGARLEGGRGGSLGSSSCSWPWAHWVLRVRSGGCAPRAVPTCHFDPGP